MIDALSKRQRQLLALIILILLTSLMFTFTAVPLLSLNTHYADTIEQLERRLQILQRKAATGNDLRTRHAQLKKILSSNRHYLKSATEALAAADLQGIVKRVSRSNRSEVLSTQILPTIKELGFSGVTLKVRMRGKLSNLVKIFHSLESGQPYLFMDNVSIRSRIQHSRKINYKSGKNSRTVDLVEMLDIEFDLTGYMPQQS